MHARSGRLAVSLLWTTPPEPSAKGGRAAEACCAIKQLRAHLLPSTPADILVFYLPAVALAAAAAGSAGKNTAPKRGGGSNNSNSNHMPPSKSESGAELASRFCTSGAEKVHFLPIHPSHWQPGAWAQEGHIQYGSMGNTGYLLMGHWRLRHQFSVLR